MTKKTSKALVGRPRALNPELQDEICTRIAIGETVRQIAASSHMPAASTIYLTLANDAAFAAQYTQAREAQCLRWEDELLEIADDSSNDWIEREGKGGTALKVIDHEHIARSKVRVDTRKWLMSKRLPKKYGERVTQEHSGPDGGPIQTKELSEIDIARRIAFALAKGARAQRQSGGGTE